MKLRRLAEDNTRKDIISGLPDDVLCHIFSCLPTEDAVRTTVLSSRWKSVWTSIYNLCFDYKRMYGHNKFWRTQFVNFVDRVLLLCQSKGIHDFHLQSSYLQKEDLSHVTRWLCFAANHNVRRLTVDVDISSYPKQLLQLPQSFLTCKTLVKLDIRNDFLVDIPDSTVCFPSLKILHLRVEYPNGDVMQKFLGGCPVLEDLLIYGSLDPYYNVQTFNIDVPMLKRLTISVIVEYEHFAKHKFVIRTPNLEYLDITVYTFVYFLVNEIPFLKEAHFRIGCNGLGCDAVRRSPGITENEVNRALQLLRGTKNRQILSLPDGRTPILSFAYGDNLPTFSNLIHLNLEVESCFGWRLLTPFLNNSPNLEVLTLNLFEVNKLTPNQLGLLMYGSLGHYSKGLVYENLDWVEPEDVPICLLLRVKVIKIIRMRREVQQLNVARYLLENSEVLEMFSVGFDDLEAKENLQNEILMSPRGSKSCTIEFL